MFVLLDKDVTYTKPDGTVYHFKAGNVVSSGRFPGIEKHLAKSPSDKMVRPDEVKTK